MTEPADYFAPEADMLADANDILNTHWLRPDEEWRPMCEHCAYGTCHRVIWAEAWLMRLARQGRPAGGAPC